MASLQQRLSENVPGDFFVDSTCIDCDACRIFAPTVFSDQGDQSFVFHQPESEEERLAAEKALLSCPTASIGTRSRRDMSAAVAALPELVDGDVYRCGYASESSFGAISYYLRDARTLVDSPRFNAPLARKLEGLGGVARMLLTHQDDVADADRYAAHFRSRRIIHRDELSSQPGAEVVLDGPGPWPLAPGFLAIPTPGHTRGHCVLLFGDRFLFTGDHLDWDRDGRRLAASEDYCWYSWPQQAESMRRLADYRFEWVLPGHGRIHHDTAARMREHLLKCIEWMKK